MDERAELLERGREALRRFDFGGGHRALLRAALHPGPGAWLALLALVDLYLVWGRYYLLGELVEHLWRMADDSARAGVRARRGRYLQQTGDLVAAREEFRQAVSACTEGDEPLVEALLGLGEVHLELGSHVQAEAAFKRARALLPEDPLLRPRLLVGMARLSIAQGKFPRAERLLEAALEGSSRPHPERGRCLEARALLLEARRRQAAGATGLVSRAGPETGGLLLQAVAAQEEVFGRDHPFLVPSLLALADWHRDQGEQTLASDCTGRALALAEAHLPADHPWTRQARSRTV